MTPRTASQSRQRRGYADIDPKWVGEREEGAWLHGLRLQTASQVAGALGGLVSAPAVPDPQRTGGGGSPPLNAVFLSSSVLRAPHCPPSLSYHSSFTGTRRHCTLWPYPRQFIPLFKTP